jgi:excisionase family DNA binding protein
MEPVNRRTYSIEEAAQMLGVSRNHAYDMAKEGQLPAIKLGKRLVIPKAPFDRMLDGK